LGERAAGVVCGVEVWGLESALLTEMAVVFVGNKLLEEASALKRLVCRPLSAVKPHSCSNHNLMLCFVDTLINIYI
jgi:hypothetical protein